MKKNAAVQRVIYAVVLTISAAVILTAAFGSKEKNGFILGPFSMFTVLTGSMSPTFDAGSIIITQKTDADKLKIGDILTYRPLNDNTLVTHRIVEVIHDGNDYRYRTRGDANNVDDMSPVSSEAIVGRVIYWANGVGTVLLLIRTPKGIICIILLVALLVILASIFSEIKSGKLKLSGGKE